MRTCLTSLRDKGSWVRIPPLRPILLPNHLVTKVVPGGLLTSCPMRVQGPRCMSTGQVAPSLESVRRRAEKADRKNAAEKEALSEMSDDSREPRRARTDQARTRTLVRPGKRIASAVLGAYIVLGVFTLCFQVDVRSQECTGTANCAVSMAKGAAWS